MKHLFLFAGLVGFLPPAQAQTPDRPTGPVVSVGVYGVSANVGAQVEQRIGHHFSLSVLGARYFSADYPGYQAALAARYYFRPKAPLGFYLQAQAGAFRTKEQVISDYPGHYSQSGSQTNGHGGGLGLGYQWRVGQRLVANFGFGLKFYPHHLGEKCDCSYVGDWYALGQPGSLLDGQLSIGYAF